MKGEFAEQHHSSHLHHHLHQLPQSKHENSPSQAMFSNLQAFSSHSFQLSRDADDDNGCLPTQALSALPNTPKTPNPNRDGATIEVVRRPRGRPPGSKNKPKPPVILARDPAEPAMCPYILEVQGGNDIVEAVNRFCRRRNISVCILTGSGTVANVTLRQPSTAPVGSTVTFHGRFDILSISATLVPQPSSSSFPLPNGFTISLAGPQGQIVGGIVAGSLMSAGTVFIIAATFSNPTFHRLPMEIEEGRNNSLNISGGGGDNHSPGASVSGSRGDNGEQQVGTSGMYGCHLSGSDVLWAPTARPPPPY